MRTKKALKNIIISVGAQLFLLTLGLLTRRLLLQEFETELVGYDALLSSIFAVAAVADFGSESLFTYRLYAAFAKDDKKELGKLLGMYRTLCAVLGGSIGLILTVLYFFLPAMFEGRVALWGYFRLMYVLYAISTVSSYFLGYRRVLFVAGQREFRAVQIETAVNATVTLLKVFLLWVMPNYLLYLTLSIGAAMLNRLWVALLSKKEYPDIHIKRVSLEDYKSAGFFKDIKDLYLTKFFYTINLSTDSLLITFLQNAYAVALYSNYILIGSRLIDVFGRVAAPLTATVADLVNKEGKESALRVYKELELIYFFISSIAFTGFVAVFQNAICVFFGETYLLPMAFVIAYAFYVYVYIKITAVSTFRSCFGDFSISRRYDGYSMIANLVVSFLLFKVMGIAGITLGTGISLCVLCHGRYVVVENHLFHRKLAGLWGRELLFFLLAAVEAGVAWLLTKNIPYSFETMILRCVLSVAVPGVINVIIFHRTESFRGLLARATVIFKKN